jgi:hypothetical protein
LLNVLYLGEESMVWARWVYCAKVNRKVALARLVYCPWVKGRVALTD